MRDILTEIVTRRREDLQRLGPTFGVKIPEERKRPIVPFLGVDGTILEIKRSSPSKGDIAMGLDPVAVAKAYDKAGTQAISVLTEGNYFHGSLNDLLVATEAAPRCSFLRKDFLLEEEEIEIAYRCGADAVLLIARILSEEKLLRMAARARFFGMTPFIEVRTEKDVLLLQKAASLGPVIAGVNSRDLATFHMDSLIPAAFRSRLPCKAVFESGALYPEDAAFARHLGFEGILIGEAAAKHPEMAGALVSAFVNAVPNRAGDFWKKIAERRETLRKELPGRPLVKICGITNAEDGLNAFQLGADLLGFVFAKSPRSTDEKTVREVIHQVVESAKKKEAVSPEMNFAASVSRRPPLFIGVITDPASETGKTALRLAEEGVLDAVQFHGCALPHSLVANYGRYAAVRIGSEENVQTLLASAKQGEPRTLIDARVEGALGGTGQRIPHDLVKRVASQIPLGLAGGIDCLNVKPVIEEFQPELIDLSSALESSPGKKDLDKMKRLFAQLPSKEK